MATGSRMSCDCSITFVKNDAVPKNVKEANELLFICFTVSTQTKTIPSSTRNFSILSETKRYFLVNTIIIKCPFCNKIGYNKSPTLSA